MAGRLRPIPEVVRVLSDLEVMKDFLEEELHGGEVEVREHRDGSWTVHHPRGGWIACSPDCKIKHTHDVVRPLEQTDGSYTYAEALVVAHSYRRKLIVKPLDEPKPRQVTAPPPLPTCSLCSTFANMTGTTITITFGDGRKPLKGLLCDKCAKKIPGKKQRK